MLGIVSLQELGKHILDLMHKCNPVVKGKKDGFCQKRWNCDFPTHEVFCPVKMIHCLVPCLNNDCNSECEVQGIFHR